MKFNLFFCYKSVEIIDGDFLGCYNDASIRDLNGTKFSQYSSMSIKRCIAACYYSGYKYAGLQNG